MGLGSQSLIAVLSSCALLSNALWAALLHNERVTRRYLVAAAAIVAGALCVVLSAPHGNQVRATETKSINTLNTTNPSLSQEIR
jgi:drug/metabolite transporter (DMT)-like permease